VAIEVTADTDATTYASVETADAVAATRVGGSAWTDLGDEDKLAALTTATRDVDTLDWIGDRASDAQELEWPRTGTDYSDDAWPTRLVNAVIELAFSYAPGIAAGTNPLATTTNAGNIKRKKIGPLETEYFGATTASSVDVTTAARFPAIVQNLLAPLVRPATAMQWGSGTAFRGS
jgi:hypothetical protein